MRKLFLIVPALFLACASGKPVDIQDGGWCDDSGCYDGNPPICNFPEGAYTATYTKLNGDCLAGGVENVTEYSERSWFPSFLNVPDNCEQTAACSDGVINGSSFCTRSTSTAEGTLDGTLVFDTNTNSGTLELQISAVNYHGSKTCTSTYEVTYSK
jgi:hypothetical protein